MTSHDPAEPETPQDTPEGSETPEDAQRRKFREALERDLEPLAAHVRVEPAQDVPDARAVITEVAADGTVGGSEVDLLTEYAATIDAEVHWVPGGENVLAAAMKEGDLDVVGRAFLERQ